MPGRRLAVLFGIGAILAAIFLWLVLQAPEGSGQTLRSPLALSPAFWVQFLTGTGAYLIGAFVWALRPRDLSAALFALSGFSTLLFTFSAGIGNSTAIALPESFIWAMILTNAGGACLFGIVMILLFIIYPVKLPGWKLLAGLTLAGFGGWTLMALTGIGGGQPIWVQVITFSEMIGILIVVALQIWVTRGQPQERAIALWLGLSVVFGSGPFIALVAMPNTFGHDSLMEERYAFAFFILIYIGLAVGMTRYRLFELGDWAFQILFYTVGAALLVVLDAILLLVLPLDAGPALSLSIFLVAILYLPARDWIARKVLRRNEMSEEELFRAVVDVAFEPAAEKRAGAWEDLFRRHYGAVECEPAATGIDEPEIREEGLALALPPISGLPGLILRYPWGGRGLFSPRHRETAFQLVRLMRQAEESRIAYDRGIREERTRIARDMHDNIGSQLLSALHSKTEGRKDVLIRETLTDIRDIINNPAGEGLSVDEALADLRAETAERLEAADIALNWTVEADMDAQMSPAATHALRSVVREAVSNVVKHSGATAMTIAVVSRSGTVDITMSDNGKGFDPAAIRPGNGLKNIADRLTALGGKSAIGGEAGTRVEVHLPLTAV